jgi:ATP-dependent 26S proteasome regulatory subunit
VGLSDQVEPEVGWELAWTEVSIKFTSHFSPKIDQTVAMMQVKEKSDVGGCKEQFGKLWHIKEAPLLHSVTFVNFDIELLKGVLFGPQSTGKTLCARAVANITDAFVIRITGPELIDDWLGLIGELFEMTRTKKTALFLWGKWCHWRDTV